MAVPAICVCVHVHLSHISLIFKYLFVRGGGWVVHRPALCPSQKLQHRDGTAVKRHVLNSALTPRGERRDDNKIKTGELMVAPTHPEEPGQAAWQQ